VTRRSKIRKSVNRFFLVRFLQQQRLSEIIEESIEDDSKNAGGPRTMTNSSRDIRPQEVDAAPAGADDATELNGGTTVEPNEAIEVDMVGARQQRDDNGTVVTELDSEGHRTTACDLVENEPTPGTSSRTVGEAASAAVDGLLDIPSSTNTLSWSDYYSLILFFSHALRSKS
jgi:hypothetical protein